MSGTEKRRGETKILKRWQAGSRSWVKEGGLELHYELCISESCIKIKINLIFTLWGATKSFMKAFKAVIKSFETPQRNLELII